MGLYERIGFDAGSTRLEDALDWAATHGLHYVDFNGDTGPNHLANWSKERVRAVRQRCDQHDIHLGLHTTSGVNVAELAPYVGDAIDQYLRASIDFALRLGCGWVIVHAGYHFSSIIEARKSASLERLKRTVEYAERIGALLLLENLNFEPRDAEVHYLAHNVEECRFYFDAIPSEHLGWAFTANHAHLVPEDIDGFLDAFGIDRIGEVRLADNLGVREVHLKPGDGNIDFRALLDRLESSGYRKHYTMSFGSVQDKLEAREMLAKLR